MSDNRINYYNDFQCIADRCPYTCCQEWKISVDKNTLSIWGDAGFEKKYGKLENHITRKDGENVIKLNAQKQCNFLNKQHLCKLVVENGEQFIPDTCKKFPREILKFDGYQEMHLMSSCPAVIDLLKKQKRIYLENQVTIQENGFVIRDLMIRIMDKRAYKIEVGIKAAFYVLHECMQAENSLEYVKEIKQQEIEKLILTIEQISVNSRESYSECNELFMDIAVNYKKQDLYYDFLEEIYAQAEQLSEQTDAWDDCQEFEQIMMEYQGLIRNYLVNEILGNLYFKDYTVGEMMIAFQWIGIVYVSIRQALYLSWKLTGEISYKKLKQTIVILSRMTGYQPDDIEYFMKKNFDRPLWEWGYMALIIA